MVNSWLCKTPVSKFVTKTYENLRLRDPSEMIPKFWDWSKTFRDPSWSETVCLILKIFYVTFITKISSARVMITACNRTYLQLKVKIHLHRIMHALSSSNLARSHQMHPRISLLAWERIQENYLLKIKITLTSLSDKLMCVMIAVLQRKEASANISLALP